MAIDVDHPKAGRITITKTPLKLTNTPGQVRRPAPTLSQHTDEILHRLGYDDATVAQYHDEGVV
jgi:crotonobetainyl-CoA:carnitine CoA-transferase CaiB-like acyl-CoA transferase